VKSNYVSKQGLIKSKQYTHVNGVNGDKVNGVNGDKSVIFTKTVS